LKKILQTAKYFRKIKTLQIVKSFKTIKKPIILK